MLYIVDKWLIEAVDEESKQSSCPYACWVGGSKIPVRSVSLMIQSYPAIRTAHCRDARVMLRVTSDSVHTNPSVHRRPLFRSFFHSPLNQK